MGLAVFKRLSNTFQRHQGIPGTLEYFIFNCMQNLQALSIFNVLYNVGTT